MCKSWKRLDLQICAFRIKCFKLKSNHWSFILGPIVFFLQLFYIISIRASFKIQCEYSVTSFVQMRSKKGRRKNHNFGSIWNERHILIYFIKASENSYEKFIIFYELYCILYTHIISRMDLSWIHNYLKKRPLRPMPKWRSIPKKSPGSSRFSSTKTGSFETSFLDSKNSTVELSFGKWC